MSVLVSPLLTVLVVIMGFLVVIFIVGFSRALSVRLATGYWPHQNEDAMRLFRSLP